MKLTIGKLKQLIKEGGELVAVYAPVDPSFVPNLSEEPRPTLNKDDFRFVSHERDAFTPGNVLVDEDGDVWYMTRNYDEVEVSW